MNQFYASFPNEKIEKLFGVLLLEKNWRGDLFVTQDDCIHHKTQKEALEEAYSYYLDGYWKSNILSVVSVNLKTGDVETLFNKSALNSLFENWDRERKIHGEEKRR